MDSNENKFMFFILIINCLICPPKRLLNKIILKPIVEKGIIYYMVVIDISVCIFSVV